MRDDNYDDDDYDNRGHLLEHRKWPAPILMPSKNIRSKSVSVTLLIVHKPVKLILQ